MSAIGRPRSLPRVSGTMQNEQRMLQPCMMETKAEASWALATWSRMVFCEPSSSAMSQTVLPRSENGGIVHAGFEPALEDGVHVFENLVVFLRADDHIEAGHGFEKLLAARLGHAAHEAIDDVFPVAARVHHGAHFAERLLLRLVAHRAGVDEDGVGLVFVGRDRVAALAEHAQRLARSRARSSGSRRF